MREEEDDNGDDGDVNFILNCDGNDDDVCLIALPLFHRCCLDSFYMNTNFNAISKIHQGIDGIKSNYRF